MDAQLMLDELKKDLEAKVIFTNYSDYVKKKATLNYLPKEIQPQYGFEMSHVQLYGRPAAEPIINFSDIIGKYDQAMVFGLNEEAIPVVRVYAKTNGKQLF